MLVSAAGTLVGSASCRQAPSTRHVQVLCLGNGSRYSSVRSGGRLKVLRARRCRWHGGVRWKVLAAKIQNGTCRWCVFATEATVKLQLIESSLRLLHGAMRTEADSRCVLVAAAGTAVESACHQARGTCRWCNFATGDAIYLRLIEQACGCSTV